jgi:putative oxidoreductase
MAGAGIARHGYQKVFEGQVHGLTAATAAMGFPMPAVFAWAAALSEFLGGILVALGLFTRPAAFLVFATMSVAAFGHHRADPLAVKELALSYWTVALALVLAGPGGFSLDKLFGYEKGR